MRLRLIPTVAAAAAAALPLAAMAVPAGPEQAAGARTPRVASSADLWATINVCDTLAHPNTVGVRGSMPGLGRPATAWMRFKVQYLATKGDGRWHDAGASADSGWKRLRRVSKGVVEAGQDFAFQPPATGGAHRLRGVVVFKWTRGGRTAERLRRVTEAGHRSSAGADPDGYSAGTCDIT